jgi:tight adherence protein B
VTSAAGIAFAAIAAALGAIGVGALIGHAIARVATRAGVLAGWVTRGAEQVLAPLRRAGAEGRHATRRERRRLRVLFALASLPLAWVLANPLAGAILAGLAAMLAPRALVWRRDRYVRRLDDGAAGAAAAIADALTSGHSTRAAISVAAGSLTGPMATELRRAGADLDFGAGTDDALAALRDRSGSPRVGLLVAAIRLQRRSGGNLAGLLRDIARALDDQARLDAEARAETAQARFTSTVVLGMPLAVLALGELASPGMLARITGSALGLWLLVSAALLQLGGATLVRRLGRVEA